MDGARVEFSQSKKRLESCNHMLNVSYRLLKDPKILLSVATNLLKACEFAINSLLEIGVIDKVIPKYKKNDFQSKYNLFIQKIISQYNIDKIHIKTVSKLKELVSMHKKSSVEFTRKKKFVMADESYELRTLSENDMKNYYQKTKKFLEQVEGVLHERLS